MLVCTSDPKFVKLNYHITSMFSWLYEIEHWKLELKYNLEESKANINKTVVVLSISSCLAVN